MSADIGGRVAASLPLGPTQREIAAEIGMSPDAFSRALRGERGFAAVELARLADYLGQDLHFLITGQPDPARVIAAARHVFDHDTRSHKLPAVAKDVPHLEGVVLAYEQVQGDFRPSDVPVSIEAARVALGPDFVRTFADRLDGIDIDVVRLKEIDGAYSFRVGDRAVIALKATGNWFWENWSMAHELGHLVYQSQALSMGLPADQGSSEIAANAFAAELLLPEDFMRSITWSDLAAPQLATHVWNLGVSTDALVKRLNGLALPVSPEAASWASQPTQRLLRRHWRATEEGDPITSRMDAATARRFPLALQDAHLARIASGLVRKDTLAWMLGVDLGSLEVDEPTDESLISADTLARTLGL